MKLLINLPYIKKIKKNIKKSQLSIEFLYMIMFGSLFLILFLAIFSDFYKDLTEDKKNKLFYDFGSSIRNEILTASESKEGYERIFEMPEKLENFNYSVKIEKNLLILNYTTNIAYFYIPEIKGELKKGKNLIKKNSTSIFIENIN